MKLKKTFITITTLALIVMLSAGLLYVAYAFSANNTDKSFADMPSTYSKTPLVSSPGSNGVVAGGYVPVAGAVAIGTDEQLKAFISSDVNGHTENNAIAAATSGYLTSNLTLDWTADDLNITDKADQGRRAIVFEKTLDGAGKSITIAPTCGEQVIWEYHTGAHTDSVLAGEAAHPTGYFAAVIQGGSLKNINFISNRADVSNDWRETIGYCKDAGLVRGTRSIMSGLICGASYNATIDNCSLAINASIKKQYSFDNNSSGNQAQNKNEQERNGVFGGGFAGIQFGGVLSNCSVDIANGVTFEYASRACCTNVALNWYHRGVARCWVGGMVGSLQTGSIVNSTTTGNGNVIALGAAEKDWGKSCTSDNWLGASGIIAGMNAHDDGGSIAHVKSQVGNIDGVISNWTGMATSNSSGKTKLTNFINGHAMNGSPNPMQGVLVGYEGNWVKGPDPFLGNIYFVDMAVPTYFVAITGHDNADFNSSHLKINQPKVGTMSFCFEPKEGTVNTSLDPILRYSVPNEDNNIVWSWTLKKNAETTVERLYDKITSATNASTITSTSCGKFLRESLNNDQYEITLEAGKAVYYNEPVGLTPTATPGEYTGATKEYDKNGLPTIALNLYKDISHTALIKAYSSPDLWQAYKGDNFAVPYNLNAAVDAARWTVRTTRDQTTKIDFAVKNTADNINYVAYTADNTRVSIIDTITPKAVNLGFTEAVVNTEFANKPIVWNSTVTSGQVVAGDTVNVTLGYFMSDGAGATDNKAQNVGSYYVKATALDNPNYSIKTELKANFDVTPRIVSIKWNDKVGSAQFVYDGQPKKATYSVADTAVTNPDFEIIGMLESGIANVSYDNSRFFDGTTEITDVTNSTYTNAGWYKVFVTLDGVKANNYAFDPTTTTEHKYFIDRVTLTVTADGALSNVVDYDGNVKTFVAKVAGAPGEFNPKAISTLFTKHGTSETFQNSVTAAGVYDVKFKMNGGAGSFNSNYHPVDVSGGTFTISALEAVVSFGATPPTSSIFDGSIKTFEATIASGILIAEQSQFTISGYEYMFTPFGAAQGTAPVKVDNVRNAGEYTINAIHNISSNYNVKGASMAYTINVVNVNIVANGIKKIYGDVNPEVKDATSWTYALESGQFDVTDGIVVSLGNNDVGQYAPVGSYAVNLLSVTGAGAGNYNVTLAANQLFEVAKRQVTVEYNVDGAVGGHATYQSTTFAVANAQNITYVGFVGEFDTTKKPTYGFTYFTNKDTVLAPIDGAQMINAGKYAIKLTLDAASLLNFELVDGTGAVIAEETIDFVIDKLDISIDTTSNSSVYGDALPALAWGYTVGSKQFYAVDAITTNAVAEGASQFSGANTYSIKVTNEDTLAGVKVANYNVIIVNGGVLTVAKRDVTVTITVPTNAIYKAEAFVATALFANTVNSDTITPIFTYNNGLVDGPAINVGNYTATCAINEANYNLTGINTSNFVIAKRIVNISSVDRSVTYGDPVPTDFAYTVAELNFIASDNVVVTYTTPYAQFKDKGEYPITLTSNADVNNYDITYPTNVKLTVNVKNITAKVTSVLTPTEYNGIARPATAEAQNVVNGDLVELEILYNTLATAPINAGTYTITANSKNPNYNITSIDGGNSFEITKIAITYSVTDGIKGFSSSIIKYRDVNGNIIQKDPYSIISGAVLAQDAADITTKVGVAQFILDSEETYFTGLNDPSEKSTPGGLIIKMTGGNSANYEIKYNNNVGGALVIFANDINELVLEKNSSVYDATNKLTGGSNIVIVNARPQDITVTYKTKAGALVTDITAAGEYIVNIEVNQDKQMYYGYKGTPFTIELAYTVEKRIVNVAVASDINVVYGDAVPTLAWDYEVGSLQLVGTDTFNITTTYTATSNANASYPIKIELAQPNSNYIINYGVGKNIIVARKVLTVGITLATDLIYSGTEKVATSTIEGVMNGDNLTVALVYTIGSVAGGLNAQPINAGEYFITATITGLTDNYSYETATQAMTVAKRELTLTFDLESGYNKVYDGAAHNITVGVQNVVGLEGVTIISTYNMAPYVLDTIKNAGKYSFAYSLDDTNAINNNYTISALTTTYDVEIAKKEITVDTFAPNANLVYNGEAKDATFTVGGAVVGELVTTKALYNGEISAKNAGKYTVVISLADGNAVNDNYTMAVNSNIFEVSKAVLTIDQANITMPSNLIFDGTAKVVTANFTGVVAGDNVTPTITYNGGASAINKGNYAVEISLAENQNYSFVTMGGISFDITGREVTITSFTLPTDLVYDGNAKVVSVVFAGVPDGVTVNYTITYNGVDSAVNAGVYEVIVTLVGSDIVLTGNNKTNMTIDKASQTLAKDSVKIIVNYNKLTANAIDNAVYSLDNTTWSDSNVFTKGISAEKTYKVYVKIAANSNYNESNTVEIDNLKTGYDPTQINAKLNGIGDDFSFDDIARYKEIVELLPRVAESDKNVINTNKLNATKTAYDNLVEGAKAVVDNAQNVGAKAAGKTLGAAAAAVSISLLGMALAIAKKKMLF